MDNPLFVPSDRSYRRRLAISLMLLLMAFVGLTVGCGKKESLGEMKTVVSAADLDIAQQKMKLLLPLDINHLGIWTQSEPNESIKLKLEMPKADLDRLIRNSAFDGKPITGATNASFGPNVDWWDPDNQTNLRSGHMPLGHQEGELTIGIVESSGGMFFVYLVWISGST